jgi:hypothetical protein
VWCEIQCPDFAIAVEKKTKGKRRLIGKAGEAGWEREENRGVALPFTSAMYKLPLNIIRFF